MREGFPTTMVLTSSEAKYFASHASSPFVSTVSSPPAIRRNGSLTAIPCASSRSLWQVSVPCTKGSSRIRRPYNSSSSEPPASIPAARQSSSAHQGKRRFSPSTMLSESKILNRPIIAPLQVHFPEQLAVRALLFDERRQRLDHDALLLHRIAVAHRHGTVLERLPSTVTQNGVPMAPWRR